MPGRSTFDVEIELHDVTLDLLLVLALPLLLILADGKWPVAEMDPK